jgi:hypothetical protein
MTQGDQASVQNFPSLAFFRVFLYCDKIYIYLFEMV